MILVNYDGMRYYENDEKKSMDSMGNIGKYFVHGILFSIVIFLFTYSLDILIFNMWYAALFDFVFIFLFLIILMLIAFGFVNTLLAQHIWNINPRKTISSYLGQGFLILIMLPIFGTGYYLILSFLFWTDPFTGFGLIISLLLLDGLASGYIGKYVAAEFEEVRAGTEELASVRDRHNLCPYCGKSFMFRRSEVSSEGEIICPHCNEKIVMRIGGPGLE